MRRNSLIVLLLLAVVCMMASPELQFFKKHKKNPETENAAGAPLAADSAVTDTTQMDSLQLAVYHHNKIVDDSIRLDSINRRRAGGIDAPISYTAQDSLVYDAKERTAHLYGNAGVKYEKYDLTSDRIRMNMDSSLVRAHGTKDSTAEGGVKGKPLFKMGSDQYNTDTIAFNYKTKKAFIDNVYTEQQEGFLTGKESKRDSTGIIYLQHGRYTTCDKEDPDFYIALSRAKVRPGKDVVFGPAYLVVADVPLPLAIPYGFFPFTKRYSSGFIMPTYGDEQDRGFYLREGGYYFAMSDKWDLKLLAEIYTKGSWGFSAESRYNKRYRYSGDFNFSYQDTKTGDKGMPDFARQESFKLQWTHRQDAKANPYSSLSASVNFASESYERNNLTSLYNPQSLTQTTRTSSVAYSTSFSSIGLSLSTTMNLNQNMRDSTIAMTLPDMSISLARFYPFRRKKQVGDEKWYEKIYMSYTGQISNSITTKENQLLHSKFGRDWQTRWTHNIPIGASFTLFNYINVTPSFNFQDVTLTKKVKRSYDALRQEEVRDTTYGVYNVYNWNMSVSASTKLYGFWVPSRKLFGDKIQAIRHVITPTVSLSYAPDFGASRYGYYQTYQKTDEYGNVSLVSYSPYESAPGTGKTGNLNFSIDNNLEMKVKSDKDSTGYKKISLIDQLALSMSYNMAAKVRPWSDLNMNIRLKWWKNYTFSMNAVFATYAYDLDENGKPVLGTHTEWSRGHFGRFQGTSQNFSFTLNPQTFKKWFGHKDDNDNDKDTDSDNDHEGPDTNIESNIDDTMEKGKNAAKRKNTKAETDDDGYMSFSMPWSLTVGYGITMRESSDVNKFNYRKMRYPYEFTQTLNLSGNIRISDGWNINFSSGYDFEQHKMSMTTASLQRDLHCFNMSCQVVLAPYTSYNFTFRCNASTLTDALKYDKRSGYSNAVQWY
nr:putative LPS assembly protein LptD [Prevotella sp. AGR2160]